MTKSKQTDNKAGAFIEAAEAMSAAMRNLVAQGAEAAASGAEAMFGEFDALIDAGAKAGRAKSSEEAAGVVTSYFSAFSERSSTRAREAAENLPGQFAKAVAPFETAAASVRAAFHSA